MKLQEFINIIALYSESNDAIRRFHFDFSDNLGQISAEDTQFPLLYMELTSSSNLDNPTSGYKGYEYGFNLFIVDRINQSRSNILPILNDTNLIAQDIKGYIESINGMSINDGLFIEPMNNAYYDNLSGVMMRLTITMDGGDDCPIEYNTCTQLTMEFMNTIGSIIERRSLCVNDGDTEFVIVPNGKVNVSVNGDFKELIDVPSGATISYDIEVNDGEVILYNSLGEELQRADVGSDEVKNLIAPDGKVDVMCNGYNLVTMSIPSSNTMVLNVPQSDWDESDSNVPSYIKNKPDLSGYATVIYVDNAINGLNIPSSTSDLINDSGYITLSDIPSVSFLTLTDTPSSYTGEGGKIVAVKNDGTGLEFISAGSGGNQVQSDWNQTDNNEVDYIKNKPDLSVYATVNYVDGEINSLNIPSNTSDLVNDSGFITTSALTGYATQLWVTSQIGLIDIPSSTSELINDSGYITISELSDYATVIYVNSAINGLNIPTSTSDLTNDSGFITLSSLTGYATELYVNNAISGLTIPTKTSDLINDSGFITTSALTGYATQTWVTSQIGSINIPSKTSDLTNDSGFITNSALSGYATEVYVDNEISALNIPINTSDLINDSGFITNVNVHKEDILSSPFNLTLTGAHFGKFIIMFDFSDNNITIPTDASEPFPIGTRFDGFGMVDVNIIASPGVYIYSDEDKTIVAEKTGFSLIKYDNNSWLLVGKLK